jgi:hypothetical protein
VVWQLDHALLGDAVEEGAVRAHQAIVEPLRLRLQHRAHVIGIKGTRLSSGGERHPGLALDHRLEIKPRSQVVDAREVQVEVGLTPSNTRAPSNTIEPSHVACVRGPMIGTLPACQAPSKNVQVLVMAARLSPRMPCGASFAWCDGARSRGGLPLVAARAL